MARPGLTYEEVADAASALDAGGQKVTVDAVRAALGGVGSNSTIHRHLQEWRRLGLAPVVAAPHLPDRLLADLGRELSRASAEARAEAEASLLAARADADRLAADNEALEAAHENLSERVAEMARERDAARILAEDREAEIARLGERLAQERAAAEEARLALAREQVAAQARKEGLEELGGQLDLCRRDLDAARAGTLEDSRQVVRLQALLDAAMASKTEAVESARARVDAVEAAVASRDVVARERIIALESQLAAAMASLEATGESERTGQTRIADLEAQLQRERDARAGIAEENRRRWEAASTEARDALSKYGDLIGEYQRLAQSFVATAPAQAHAPGSAKASRKRRRGGTKRKSRETPP